jgi:hypothetical protein
MLTAEDAESAEVKLATVGGLLRVHGIALFS